MNTIPESTNETYEVKYFTVQSPAAAYRFPEDARIKQVRFDETYIHLDLTDGRILSLPLDWIPTLKNAPTKERERYEITLDRKTLVWDPAKCGINDELRLSDYLTNKTCH
jgi:hypothetical protein